MIGAVGDDMFRDTDPDSLAAEGDRRQRCPDYRRQHWNRSYPGRHRHRPERHHDHSERQPPADSRRRRGILTSLRDRVSVVLVQLEIPPAVVDASPRSAACDLRLVLDPAPAQPLPSEVWRGVSVVKPNETEAEVLTGIRSRPIGVGRAGGSVVSRSRCCQTAMITLAERGRLVIGRRHRRRASGLSGEPVDTTAAGDAFAGIRCQSRSRRCRCRRRCGEDSRPVRWR